ncbi:MAG: glycosyltransferase family 39 protein [Bacteroidales bacterium]|jgi:hypothetical protein|nr:glycosyltransferase family 39 protein [Bacteroidales bacterium]
MTSIDHVQNKHSQYRIALSITATIMVLLLIVQTLLLGYLSWSTSPNRTEIGHLGASVYFWHTGKFDVFHVNPPLVRMIAGMPIALFCNPKYDWSNYSPRPQDRCEWQLGNAFVIANELNDLRIYVFLARIFCIPLVLLGGYVGFRFASELYCEWSGVLFLILWTFSPFILGWGATICPDVVATSMGVIGLYTFWRWLKIPTWGRTFIAGICLGLMLLTKLTWIIAFPIWLILWLLWYYGISREKRKPLFVQFFVIFFLSFYVINMGYLCNGSFRLVKNYGFISEMFTGYKTTETSNLELGNRFKDSLLGYIPIPLPADFIQGIDTQRFDFEHGITSYARGKYADHGWYWYYGYVLLLKEPLGVWLLIGLALLVTFFCKSLHRNLLNESTILLTILIVFLFISSQTGFSRHPRYIILLLPLNYIFISKLAHSFVIRKKRFVLFGVASLIWIVTSSLWFYPHSLSYFNESVGKPQEWPKYLLGTNIDAGQDLYIMKEWCANHPDAKPLYISCGTWFSKNKLGIQNIEEVPQHPTPGWMLISVNELYQKNSKYEWLKERKPIGMIGFSIWVYWIDNNT